MADGSGYRSVLSLEAAVVLASLPSRRQRQILDAADRIAAHPFQPGDFRSRDQAGRTVINLLDHGCLFSYWVDHASREIRITEITRI